MKEEQINLKIPMYKIINRENQIKVFASMMLDKPHLVTGYYGKLIKDMGEDIFNDKHNYLPYYISALTYYKFEEYCNRNLFDKLARRFRYHVLLIFRFIVNPLKIPNMSDKKNIELFCNNILSILRDDTLAISKFSEAVDFLKSKYLDLNFNDRKTVERRNTTDLIIQKLKEKYVIKNVYSLGEIP